MTTITLNEKEIELLKKSINHCLETCKSGGAPQGCTDCEQLEEILKKLSQDQEFTLGSLIRINLRIYIFINGQDPLHFAGGLAFFRVSAVWAAQILCDVL